MTLVDVAPMRVALPPPLPGRGDLLGAPAADRRQRCRSRADAARQVPGMAVAANPAGQPAVVGVEVGLEPRRHRCVAVDARARLHVLLGEVDLKGALDDVGPTQRRRRKQDLATGQPVAGVDHRPAHGPRRLVEQQIGDAADRAVARPDAVADDLRAWPNHDAPPTVLAVPRNVDVATLGTVAKDRPFHHEHHGAATWRTP